jgi:hypothetical protein
MDSSNTKVSNILDTNNWSDALLIKDEKGNLGPLKVSKKTEDTKISSKIDHVSEGNLAPKDDNFAPVQNISGNSQEKAELVFHPDDKEELDFFAKNIPQDDSKKYSIEKIAVRIIQKQKLDLDDKNKKIFTNILYNFFRNRKSATISRDLLTNSVLVKNKKLLPDIIDSILSVIKGIKNKIDLAGGLVVNQIELKAQQDALFIKEKAKEKTAKLAKGISLAQNPPIKTIEIPEAEDKSLSAQDEIKAALGGLPVPNEKPKLEEQLPKEPEPKPIKKEEPKKPKSKPISKIEKPKPKVEEKQPTKGFAMPSIDEDVSKKPEPLKKEELKIKELKPELEVKKEIETSLPKVSRPNMGQVSKKSISDVSTPIKEEQSQAAPLPPKNMLTGPVQELQSFDLVGFRRLGNEVDERTQKILDKINLLQQESYTKKAQGIAAWRDSPVYKLYLQIGAESMMAGKEVVDFISENESKNKETLSIEEFSTISDLNKQLRF